MAILEETRSWLLHEGWENLHLHDGDLSKLSTEFQDFFMSDPLAKQSLDIKKAWSELDTQGGISNVSKEARAILEKSPIFLQCAARRLLPDCEVLSFGLVEGKVGIGFKKITPYVCAVTSIKITPSIFQVGDILVSLNGTLLFDKDMDQIVQAFGQRERSLVIFRSAESVQKQIKVDESLQLQVQVRALLKTQTVIDEFVAKSDILFATGKGSSSDVKCERWRAFLNTVVDLNQRKLIEDARDKFYLSRRTKVHYGGLDLSSVPESVELIRSTETKSGFKGVSKSKTGRWQVQMTIVKGRKTKQIGTFDTKEEAALVFARITYYLDKYGKS